VFTWINDVVYRIQHQPKVKMMIVHLDRLAPYLGTSWTSSLEEEVKSVERPIICCVNASHSLKDQETQRVLVAYEGIEPF
jgi:hypothetical protein